MTIEELSQVKYLSGEIKSLRKEIKELSKPHFEEQYVSDGVLASSKEIPYQQRTKIIHGNADVHVKNPFSAKIAERKKKLGEELIRREDEKLKLEQYITSIPDSLTRQIFRYRFIDGMEWQRVADAVGGKNTEDSVRKVVTRYLG